MKKTFLSFAIIICCMAKSKACDCAIFSFCEHFQNPDRKIVIQARAIRSVVYGPDNNAVYLEVLKKYKENPLLTDTIKVYGNDQQAACYLDVLNEFPVGDTVIVTFSEYEHFGTPLINPDSLTENYYEVRPIWCFMVKLSVHNGIVSGRISEGVQSYPLSHFDAALQQCEFPPVVTELCHYSVYPIPSFDGKLYIRQEYLNDTIQKIRVFSIDGRWTGDFSNSLGYPEEVFPIDLPGKGVYVVEIFCNGKKYHKKVTVM